MLLFVVRFFVSIPELYHNRGKKSRKIKTFVAAILENLILFSQLIRPGLVDAQSLHEPAILLRSERAYFLRTPRPLEAACLQPLVQEKKSISLPQQPLDSIPPPPAEQEHGPLRRVELKLRLNDSCQSVNSSPQVCVTLSDVNRAVAREVIQHERSPLIMACSSSGPIS